LIPIIYYKYLDVTPSKILNWHVAVPWRRLLVVACRHGGPDSMPGQVAIVITPLPHACLFYPCNVIFSVVRVFEFVHLC